MTKLYHATNHVITKVDRKEHSRNLRSIINGNSVLGLFCNTDPLGSHVYGDRLYSFTVSEDAKKLEINSQFKEAGRCSEYYRGVRDILEALDYDVLTVTYDDGVSCVIMNFDVIENWQYEGESK